MFPISNLRLSGKPPHRPVARHGIHRKPGPAGCQYSINLSIARIGLYARHRRCSGTWWASPPSKRVGRGILVRRVRFPSTSAISSQLTCIPGACAAGRAAPAVPVGCRLDCRQNGAERCVNRIHPSFGRSRVGLRTAIAEKGNSALWRGCRPLAERVIMTRQQLNVVSSIMGE